MSGIDYSKWDRMQFSDDEDDEQTLPRVTRLNEPSQVTISPQGAMAVPSPVDQASREKKDTLMSTGSNTSTSKPKTQDEIVQMEKSSSPRVSSKIPASWTTKGGKTCLDGQTDLIWTQDRESVTLRFLVPAKSTVQGWNVQVTGRLSYANRKVGVSTDVKPSLHIFQRGTNYVLLPKTALPFPIHCAQDDDSDENDSVDWNIERSASNEAYITIHLLKASPMDGVVLWWNRPLEGAEEIDMPWRSTQASSDFQQAWDEAHRQFLEKMARKDG